MTSATKTLPLGRIREEEIGRTTYLETPFGRRLLYYADLTATGRHLRFVEEWVRSVRPYYANTHTEISTTGRTMTRLRETAREIVRQGVGAGPEDEVVFVGSGATAAVNKLVGLLGLRISEPLEREHRLSAAIPDARRPVVLVGPYEHHSNELPWLESIADVVEVDLDGAGTIDLDDLDRKLRAHADRPLRVGSFSAASNVTGVLTDVHGIARLLHRHGALAFFDYAAAGPYVPIDMHPEDPEERIDALFLSPHKFIGGPGASGVLVAHRSLFRTRTPERPGGGTVDYVAGPSRADVDYVKRLAEREEGGTPAILGDIRAGLAFLVKGWIGPEVILRHEVDMAERVARRLERHPRIQVLGPTGPERLAIVPVSIDGLHHDLASALLDHLFGIQNRAGCSCAGPYGHRLLGIGPERSALFRAWVQRGINGIKPGWARLSVPHYASEEDLEFILAAVEFVAEHGRDFVPLYRLNWRDGVWRPHDLPQADGLPVLLDRAALQAAMRPAAPEETLDEDRIREERTGYLRDATARAAELRARWAAEEPGWNPSTGHADLDRLVWFRYVHQEGLPDPAPPGGLR